VFWNGASSSTRRDVLLLLVTPLLLGSHSADSHFHASAVTHSMCLVNYYEPSPAQWFLFNCLTELMTLFYSLTGLEAFIIPWLALIVVVSVHVIWSWHDPHWKHHFRGFSVLVCWFAASNICICRRGDVFTFPLLSTVCLFCLHYSSFHSSCHMTPSLRLLVPSTLQARRRAGNVNICSGEWHLSIVLEWTLLLPVSWRRKWSVEE
jgi:hypothetical protein